MAYREAMDKVPSRFEVRDPELIPIIQKALDEGKKVEWEFSSFKDPEDYDWSKVFIDDVELPGSFQKGY